MKCHEKYSSNAFTVMIEKLFKSPCLVCRKFWNIQKHLLFSETWDMTKWYLGNS